MRGEGQRDGCSQPYDEHGEPEPLTAVFPRAVSSDDPGAKVLLDFGHRDDLFLHFQEAVGRTGRQMLDLLKVAGGESGLACDVMPTLKLIPPAESAPEPWVWDRSGPGSGGWAGLGSAESAGP